MKSFMRVGCIWGGGLWKGFMRVIYEKKNFMSEWVLVASMDDRKSIASA